MAYCKKHIHQRGHFERRRGTAQEAKDYATKDDTRHDGPYEIGVFTPVVAGQRTDLDALVETAKRTGSLKRCVEEHPTSVVKYPRGTSLLCRHFAHRRTLPPSVFLLYGPTGCGKTSSAFDTYPELYRKAPGTRWFDGYDQQSVVLFDEFCGRSSGFRLDHLLQLIDRYPIDVEVKGDYVPLLATTIIFTSNIHPYQWYDWENRREQYAALARRIHLVYTFIAYEKKEVNHEHFFNIPDGPIPGTELDRLE